MVVGPPMPCRLFWDTTELKEATKLMVKLGTLNPLKSLWFLALDKNIQRRNRNVVKAGWVSSTRLWGKMWIHPTLVPHSSTEEAKHMPLVHTCPSAKEIEAYVFLERSPSLLLHFKAKDYSAVVAQMLTLAESDTMCLAPGCGCRKQRKHFIFCVHLCVCTCVHLCVSMCMCEWHRYICECVSVCRYVLVQVYV